MPALQYFSDPLAWSNSRKGDAVIRANKQVYFDNSKNYKHPAANKKLEVNSQKYFQSQLELVI